MEALKPSRSDLAVDADSDSSSSLSSPGPESDVDGDSSPAPTEWLVTTRQRRSTAGNRMMSLLAKEEPDSDMELLFAEDDDDRGFSDATAAADGSDVQMDSSDDEDDRVPGGNDEDELEGEKELERQAREKRAAQRKRKAQEAIPARFRKKVQIRPNAPSPAPRPKKKSERVSWLPLPADMPTRASSRRTTRLSKEQLHQQMVEREARRRRQQAQMHKKAARLAALKKPPMTQEDRLREAEEVERRNSKSLSRWEEAEKQREEERMAKLAALNERTLKGPVITFWSGRGQGRHVVVEERQKPRKKREKVPKAEQTTTTPGDPSHATADASGKLSVPSDESHAVVAYSKPAPAADSSTTQPATSPPTHQGGDDSRDGHQERLAVPSVAGSETNPKPLSGCLAPPDLASPLGLADSVAKSDVLAPPDTSQGSVPPPSQAPMPPPPPTMTTSSSTKPDEVHPNRAPETQRTSPQAAPTATDTTLQPIENEATVGKGTAAAASERPSVEEQSHARGLDPYSANNAIIFQNFDENAIKDRTIQTQILFDRKMTRLAKPQHQPLCAITNYPARYRDPGTGLPYANFHAYREIQRLRRGDYKWSALLGAWVGSCTSAARGVPERFLNADKAREMKQQRDRERAEKKVEEEAEEESKTKEKKMQPQQDKAREGEVQESETKEEAKHEGQNALSAEDGVSLKRDQGAGAGVKADEDEAAAAQEPPPTLHADPTKTSA